MPLLLAFAAGLHLAAMPSHLQEGRVVGGFFVFVAIAQLVAAVLVHRGTAPVVRAFIAAGNLAVVAVWAVSRTAGLALGGHGSAPEPVGLLDALAISAGLAAVAGLYLFSTTTRPRPSRLAGLPALTVVALLVAGAGLPFAPSAHSHPDGEADRHVNEAPAATPVAAVTPMPEPTATPVTEPAPAEHSHDTAEPHGH